MKQITDSGSGFFGRLLRRARPNATLVQQAMGADRADAKNNRFIANPHAKGTIDINRGRRVTRKQTTRYTSGRSPHE
ncbi:MAG: hypothetical protein ACRYG5_02785 [Janthinobacterium lividum]